MEVEEHGEGKGFISHNRMSARKVKFESQEIAFSACQTNGGKPDEQLEELKYVVASRQWKSTRIEGELEEDRNVSW